MPQEKLSREDFMNELKERTDFLIDDDGIDWIERKLDAVYWTAYNQGATMERLRLEEGLQIPNASNGYKTKA